MHWKPLTLKLLEVIHKYLLPMIYKHYPANRLQEYSYLSGQSCYLDLTLKSHNLFTRKYEAARGKN